MAESENNQLLSAVTEEQAIRYINTRSGKNSAVKTQQIAKASTFSANTSDHTQEHRKGINKKRDNKRIKSNLPSEATQCNNIINHKKRVLETDTEETERLNTLRVKRRKGVPTNIANRTRSQTVVPSDILQSAKKRQSSQKATSSASESKQKSKKQFKNLKKGQCRIEKFDKHQKLIEPNKSSRSLRSSVVQVGNDLLNKEHIEKDSNKEPDSIHKVYLSGPKNSLGTTKKCKRVSEQTLNIDQPDTYTFFNLGAHLARGSSGRQPQHDVQGPLPSLLRRSSRAKSSTNIATMSSCSSTSAQTSALSSHSLSSQTGKILNSVASTSKTQNSAGPSSSKTDIEKSYIASTMAENFGNSNEERSSNTGNKPFIKLHKLSMPLLDVSGSIQHGTSTNSTSIASGGGAAQSGISQHQDSESDDSEVGRLQALLEARGLPPQLFGALGPRMHHLLHRTMGTNSTCKAQTLLQGLQSNDESQQLQAAIEMCQMLVMGNEDTLAGFPIKQVVPALIILLRMEHNFDLMMNACRALAYMLEALPRSSVTVVEAIPAFLEKLQVIQWVDVAEQSLTALEILSRRHSKCILHANGVSACLTYLDFFSINAQRSALAVTANCCQNLHGEEFHHIKESLPLLARLLGQQDKKSVESICTAFYRLVDSFQNDAYYLKEVASMEFLKNCQQLLILVPSMLSSSTFTNVIRMLSIMCANCPNLAITLLKDDIAATLLFLLTGSMESVTKNFELVSKNPSELYEITCLIGELIPRLPSDGIFDVDSLLEKQQFGQQDVILWQWKDDGGVWHSYNSIDCRMIEAAHINSDEEINLTALGRTYTIDFNSMQQINEESGTARVIQRKVNSFIPLNSISKATNLQITTQDIDNSSNNLPVNVSNRQINNERIKEERELTANFIKSLFGVLYEVYTSSAGPAVRYKCLKALLRMIYFANSNLLQEVLSNQLVSSHIAGMMASNDIRIVVCAIQMAEMLMQKLPDDFSIHFRREGVMHQVNYLADPSNPIYASVSSKSGKINLPCRPHISNMSLQFEQASTSREHANSSDTSVHLVTTMSSISSASSSQGFSKLQSKSLNITNDFNINKYGARSPQSLRDIHSLQQDEILVSETFTENASENGKTSMITSSSESSSLTSQNAEDNTRFLQTRMTDILKRKAPSKRKAQLTTRTKNRSDHSTTSPPVPCSSNLNNKLTSDRSSPSTSGSSSKSKLYSASSKTTSFLQSLNPVRWRKSSSQSSSVYKDNTNSFTKCATKSNLITAGNREKARQWIKNQSVSFVQRYYDNDCNGHQSVVSILMRLKAAIQKLKGDFNDCIYSLREIKAILIESDISPFEVNNSGLIKALINYMTNEDGIVERDKRLLAFLHIFVDLPVNGNFSGPAPLIDPSSFNELVTKLNACVTQLEQFPLKVHDFPTGIGGRSNTSALKFFNTHQLKCNLQRHPDCNNLRRWKGGTVKIDPLALVQAIERYLVVRGYSGIKIDSEEDSDEDIDNMDGAALAIQGGTKHKLQFSIGNNILPYNITVYQAIKQFSSSANDQSETDTDSETTIAAKASRQLQDPLVIMTGNLPQWLQQMATICPFLFPFETRLLLFYAISFDRDRALQRLLEITPDLNSAESTERVTPRLDRRKRPISRENILKQAEVIIQDFGHSKALLEIQYEDEVGTGLGPTLEFYALVSTELQRCDLDLWNNTDSYKRKGSNSTLINDVLEAEPSRIQESCNTVSSVVQNQISFTISNETNQINNTNLHVKSNTSVNSNGSLNIQIDQSDTITINSEAHANIASHKESNISYVNAPTGLFPCPLGKNTKTSQITRLKSKFRFLGKFMAKAVMDSRMLDLPFSIPFYRWILGEELTLGLADLQQIAPELQLTLLRLNEIVKQRDKILTDGDLDGLEKTKKIESLNLDGCLIADLGLDFILPGHSSIELKRGGKEIAVTIHNLHQYISLVAHWFMNEGVVKQFEALREGFDSVFPLHRLKMFYPEELENVFCGTGINSYQKWEVKMLTECCRTDHGFSQDSMAIKYFYDILSTYTKDEQRLFLQFVTGSPRLPTGGFKALTPPLTIVRKKIDVPLNPDDYLPSVMTCVNYLKLPDYSNQDVMREKLQIAASEGRMCFHLS